MRVAVPTAHEEQMKLEEGNHSTAAIPASALLLQLSGDVSRPLSRFSRQQALSLAASSQFNLGQFRKL